MMDVKTEESLQKKALDFEEILALRKIVDGTHNPYIYGKMWIHKDNVEAIRNQIRKWVDLDQICYDGNCKLIDVCSEDSDDCPAMRKLSELLNVLGFEK